jgi:hypothetical protein
MSYIYDISNLRVKGFWVLDINETNVWEIWRRHWIYLAQNGVVSDRRQYGY